jgi:hypothetical protein
MGSNLPPGVSDTDIPGNRLCDIEPETTDTILVRRYLSDVRNGLTMARTFKEWLKEYRGAK